MSDRADEPDQAESTRRQGRGRLSSIDMLPEEAEEHIAWANGALRDREMPQTEILREFNARLADLGIASISKGAFSRHSVRLAIETRKLEASRKITDAVLERMSPADRTDSTLAAIELMKFRLMEMVMGEDQEPNPKLLNIASLALQRLSSTSLREAEGQRRDKKNEREEQERHRKAEEQRAQREAAQAADQAEKIASEAGLSADRIAAIRKGVLGIGG